MVVFKSQNGNLPEDLCITFEQMNIISNSNKLWMEFAFWIRELIETTIRDSERQSYIANKLFGDVIREFYILFEFYYGTQLAQQFMNLLTNFTTGIWRLAESLKNNNAEQVNAYTVQLYQSSDDLAKFLAQINLFYEESRWKSFFDRAVNLAIDEATALLANDFAREVDASSSMADLVSLMGNYMARGIIGSGMRQE